jgi:hypothetical protein
VYVQSLNSCYHRYFGYHNQYKHKQGAALSLLWYSQVAIRAGPSICICLSLPNLRQNPGGGHIERESIAMALGTFADNEPLVRWRSRA